MIKKDLETTTDPVTDQVTKTQAKPESKKVTKLVESADNSVLFSKKAEQIAKNYGVGKVWGTVDGRHWATTEASRARLPKGIKVMEYSFEPEGVGNTDTE